MAKRGVFTTLAALVLATGASAGLGMEVTLNDRIAAFFPDANKGK